MGGIACVSAFELLVGTLGSPWSVQGSRLSGGDQYH